jgi:hypothetical protein
MPQMKSQHWLFGLLGVISLGSVFYTALIGDIGFEAAPERPIESQDSIDTLAVDMRRLLGSISHWQSFCEDPYAYIRSATSHGNFAINVHEGAEVVRTYARNHITRDALGRCARNRDRPQNAEFRLCLTVKESAVARKEPPLWFDDNHLLEVNIEFREKGLRKIERCEDMVGKPMEVQTYFSAYTDYGLTKKAGRISGGMRIPLESTRL